MLKFSLKKVAIAASLLLLAGLFFITGCLTIVSGAEAPQSQKFAFTNLENEKDTAIFIDGQAKKNSEEGTMNLFEDKDSSDYIYIIEGLTNTNSEIMISMPKAVKASECDWIEIYLLLGNWGVTGSTYTKVTAYAAADTEHELQAGTMQCDAESNKDGILRIDPYKVADKDGNVQTIRLQIYSDTEQTAGQINLFLNYLRVLPADTGAVKSVTLQTGKYIAPKNPANLNDENVTWLALNCSEEAYENYGKENHAYQHYDTRSFPKAEVYDATINEGATCIRAKNGVFALDLGRVKASDYGQMSMDFQFTDWEGGIHNFYLYGSSAEKFIGESGQPEGYVAKLTTKAAATKYEFKLDKNDLAKLADKNGNIGYIYILWGGNILDTQSQIVGCYNGTNVFMSEINLLIPEDVPKPVLPETINKSDISSVFPVGEKSVLNFKTSAGTTGSAVSVAATGTGQTDEISFRIKPVTQEYSFGFVLRASDRGMTNVWQNSGVVFWFSHDNVLMGAYRNNAAENAGFEQISAKDFPLDAFGKEKYTDVKITAVPYFVDGIESGVYAAITVNGNLFVESYYAAEKITTGLDCHLFWQDLGKDVSVELASADENFTKAEDLMAVALSNTKGETGALQAEKERVSLQQKYYSIGAESISELNMKGDAAKLNQENLRLEFQKEGTVELQYSVTNIFGTFESNVLKVTYGSGDSGGCSSSLEFGSAGLCFLGVLTIASAVFAVRKNRRGE